MVYHPLIRTFFHLWQETYLHLNETFLYADLIQLVKRKPFKNLLDYYVNKAH